MSIEAPDELHAFLIESMRPLLPEGFDVDKHFTPRYRPWQQRIAIVPDGDLFAALREGKASIVTDTIETFTEHGIKVSSGEEIPADIVVSATGFNLSLLGDVAFAVDGEPVDFTGRVTWRGIMISGVPNMAYVFGYFRHSWTLRVDLVSDLVVRLLANMRDKGATMVVPALRRRTRTCRCCRSPTRRTSTPATSCARSTCCSSGATASRGPTCSSTSRNARSCPRRTSTTGPSSTAEAGRAVGSVSAGWTSPTVLDADGGTCHRRWFCRGFRTLKPTSQVTRYVDLWELGCGTTSTSRPTRR